MSKSRKQLTVFFLLSFLFSANGLLAQQGNFSEPFDTIGYKSRTAQAVAAIQDLKTGVLVVRLSSNQRKIEALRGQLATPNLSEKSRERLQLLLDGTLQETAAENSGLVAAFREEFDFSEVMFMYDTATYLLKKGIKQGYFLSDSLQADPALSLSGKTFRLAYFGSKSGMSKRKSIIGVDRNFQDIPAPFPTSGNVSFWEGFILIFKKDTNWKSDYHFHVSRFNDQLHKFYERCRSKGLFDKVDKTK